MRVLVLLAVLVSPGCVARRQPAVFRVLPAQPAYRLRAPDASETAFPEVLARFTPSTAAWVDLRPQMELRIENAYYRDGSARRDFASYLGTEVAQYRAGSRGLRLVAVQSGVAQQPAGQPPVQQLIGAPQQRRRFHRFFYEVLLHRKDELHGAVLLGAGSADELDRLATRLLAGPASVCGAASPDCTVFPPTCTVSLEIEIVVNGAPRTVLWGSFLASVAPHPRHLELLRLHAGRPTPVVIDPADPNALRLPLLPGDRVTWD